MNPTDALSICMFTNLYRPVVSGSSTQTEILARELVNRGHEVVVITAKVLDSADYEQVDGVHIYRLPAYRLPQIPIGFNYPWLSFTFTPGNLKRIKTILIRHHAQVLHLHNYMFDLAFSAVLMRRWTKKPLFVTIHTYFRHPSPFYNLFFLPIDRIVLKNLVIRQADCVVCPDYNVKEYVNDVFGKVNNALIPYGITLPKSEQGLAETLREKYHLQGKRVVLSLGHVHALRTRKDLVEAMPYILKEFPNTILLIVGTVASDVPSSLAEQLHVSDSIIFTGPVPHSHIPAYLELSDLEAHWLNEKESSKTSLGIASLETMLAGKVVLAAANLDTYGPGVLKSGENIIVVEPNQPAQLAQTVIGLLKDARRREEIGGNARRTIIEHFSWDSICAQTVEAYRKEMKLNG